MLPGFLTSFIIFDIMRFLVHSGLLLLPVVSVLLLSNVHSYNPGSSCLTNLTDAISKGLTLIQQHSNNYCRNIDFKFFSPSEAEVVLSNASIYSLGPAGIYKDIQSYISSSMREGDSQTTDIQCNDSFLLSPSLSFDGSVMNVLLVQVPLHEDSWVTIKTFNDELRQSVTSINDSTMKIVIHPSQLSSNDTNKLLLERQGANVAIMNPYQIATIEKFQLKEIESICHNNSNNDNIIINNNQNGTGILFMQTFLNYIAYYRKSPFERDNWNESFLLIKYFTTILPSIDNITAATTNTTTTTTTTDDNNTIIKAALIHGVNNSTVLANQQDQRQKGKVYITLSSAYEGVSKWLYVITDLLGAVRDHSRAVFVEPCIKNGRIVQCRNGTIPMSVVFDFEAGSQAEAASRNKSYEWISWKNFTREVMHNDFNNHDNNTHESAFCILHGDNGFQRKEYSMGRTFHNVHKHIKVHHYVECVAHAARLSAKDGKDRWIHITDVTVSQTSKIPSVNKRARLPIKKIYYDQVHTFTNATPNYIVFNWRSETIDMNVKKQYVPIVTKIGREWKKLYRNSSFFLVSDISFSTGVQMWGKMETLPNWCIDMLKKVYLKLETLPARLALVESTPLYKDAIFESIWDLILSEQADLFIACTDYRKCRRFNRWNSGFTNEILRMREHRHKNCVTLWSSKEIKKCKGVVLANYM